MIVDKMKYKEVVIFKRKFSFHTTKALSSLYVCLCTDSRRVSNP
jgi:hypothetical protein